MKKDWNPPVVVHPVPQVVGGVHRRRRVQAVVSQHLRQGGHSSRQRLPSHKGHRPAAREVVRPGGHGRESGGIVTVEPDGPGCQRIQGRRSNRRIAVCAYVVPAKGVGNYPDDIHLRCSNDLLPADRLLVDPPSWLSVRCIRLMRPLGQTAQARGRCGGNPQRLCGEGDWTFGYA